MRFLGIGKDGSLGDMYLHLSRAGHDVKAYIADPEWQGILRGMIQRTGACYTCSSCGNNTGCG